MRNSTSVARHSPVLTDINRELSRSELSALTAMLRRSQGDIIAAVNYQIALGNLDSKEYERYEALWSDLLLLRLEVRAVFLCRLND